MGELVDEFAHNQPAGAVRQRMAGAGRRDAAWPEYVRRISQGDEPALAAFYDESSSLVYSLALRMLGNPADAEEIVLDVFTQVWRSAERWEAQRGTVTAWLVTLCRSRCIDRIRSRTARAQVEAPMPESPSGPLPLADPGGSAESLNDRFVISRALDQLPAEYRKLLEMAFFSGMTHTELAEHMGMPLGTVKTRIRAAMTQMRNLLTELPA
jgi:RNA polymerase sigma-70 factor (ECF subfamily)